MAIWSISIILYIFGLQKCTVVYIYHSVKDHKQSQLRFSMIKLLPPSSPRHYD